MGFLQPLWFPVTPPSLVGKPGSRTDGGGLGWIERKTDDP
jgi:hypothetical protein